MTTLQQKLTVGSVAYRLCALVASAALWLGSATALAAAPSDPFNYSRSFTQTYDALGRPWVRTDNPGDAESCVTTTLLYDDYGNVRSSTVANCAGASGRTLFASRTTQASHAAVPAQPISVGGSTVNVAVPAGLAPTATVDALDRTTQFKNDPRFNARLEAVDANALVARNEVDDFGRVTRAVAVDGTSVVTLYCILPGKVPDNDLSSNSAGCPTPATNEAPPDAVSIVITEPRNTSNVKMGAYVRTYLDRLGRTLRLVSESYDATSQPVLRRGVRTLTDTVFDANGAKVLETAPHFLLSGSTNVDGSVDVPVTKLVYDRLGRVVATHTTDPSSTVVQDFGPTGGSFTGSGIHGSYGSRPAASTSFAFTGLIHTTTNSLGQQRREEKSALGATLRVTDHLGAQVAYQYDAFGLLLKTTDALNNSIAVQYDIAGRKIRLNDPDKGVFVHCHDALGQLKATQTSTMRGSHVPAPCPVVEDSGLTASTVPGWTTMAYDKLGRLTERVEPEFKSTWYFDAYKVAGTPCNKGLGRLCEVVTSHGVTKKFFYDALGRVASTRLDATPGQSFIAGTSYSTTTGRVLEQTYPTGVRVGYEYTTNGGYLSALRLKNAALVTSLPNAQGQTAPSRPMPADTALWSAQRVNAAGVVQLSAVVSGLIDTRLLQPGTGRLASIGVGQEGTPNSLVSHAYTWDTVGNLTMRTDNLGDGVNGAVSETFLYDGLNRLKEYTTQGAGISGQSRTVILTYNALGMLLKKSDTAGYSYIPTETSPGMPHALRQVGGQNNALYTYDLNGNLTVATGGKYGALTYTSFDRVATAAGAGVNYSWMYDETHFRLKEQRVVGANTRTTWYLHPDAMGGLGFEHEANTSPAGRVSRHYLMAGSQVVGVLAAAGSLPDLAVGQSTPPTLGFATFNKLEFWHKDHLGSLVATSDQWGTITQRYAYDPFGKRRQLSGVYDANGALVVDWTPGLNSGTDRGFTGHEELDDIGLINMNGRLFDDNLGRFIQADPLISDPFNLQSYDRYAYVLNNPLNATDPSGLMPVTSVVVQGSLLAPPLAGGLGGSAGAEQTPSTSVISKAAADSHLKRKLSPAAKKLSEELARQLAMIRWAVILFHNLPHLVDSALRAQNITNASAEPADKPGKVDGGKGANTTTGSPDPNGNNDDNSDRNKEKKIRSLEQRMQEHKDKLAEYKGNPDKFDNKGFLKNAPSQEVRDSIIQGRINHLEGEIANFQRQINTLKGL